MNKKNCVVEFKKGIVQIYLDGRRTAASLAEELGLNINTVYQWVEQFENHSSSKNIKLDDVELKNAQRRIRELEEENKTLKRAIVYFAKNIK